MLNPTLRHDVENLRADAAARIRPGLSQEVLDHAMDQELVALKHTFDLYGVPYNEDTLKAATVATIWAAKATQEIFLSGTPHHIPDNPVSHAVHGHLLAMNILFHALDKEPT